jgi:hypothetical protein
MMDALDLRNDAVDIQKLLTKAVKDYAAKHADKKTAKKHLAVTRIDVIFSLGDSESTPWVHVHFDTKPGGEPDGNPSHPDFAKLKRPGWLPTVQVVCEGEKAPVILTSGKQQKCDDDKLTETIGKFLVEMLQTANKEGVFAELPRGERCEFGVEDPTSGSFGWPNYEDRGKKNLVK